MRSACSRFHFTFVLRPGSTDSSIMANQRFVSFNLSEVAVVNLTEVVHHTSTTVAPIKSPFSPDAILSACVYAFVGLFICVLGAFLTFFLNKRLQMLQNSQNSKTSTRNCDCEKNQSPTKTVRTSRTTTVTFQK